MRFSVSIFVLFCIDILASLTLAYATPAGIGLTNDSAAYIGGARSILAGTGYSDVWLDSSLEAITHYPPLFSVSLAGLGLLSLDPLRGARFLNIFLFGANTFITGLLGWRMTRSKPVVILLALLFGLNASILRIHAYALSEPLFIFFSLLSFLSFDFSVESQKSKVAGYWLLVTGLLSGLACLTRYSGLALVATFSLAIFLINSTWRSRFTKIALFLAGAIPPLAAWFIRNKMVAQSATNRTFQYHPIVWNNVEIGIRNVSQFIMPIEPWRRELLKSGAIAWILALLSLILLAYLAITAWKLIFPTSQSPNHPITQSPNPLPFTTAIYIFGYLGAVLFSMSFFDASTKFQPRILSPLYVSGMVLFVAVLSSLTTKYTKSTKVFKNFVYFVTFVVSLFALGLSTFDFRLTTAELHNSAGLGYGSWKWRDSLVMADLKKLPPDVAIYTNSTPAVYLVTGRASRVIPTTIDPVDNLPRGDYDKNLNAMRADLLAGRAVLALFDTSGIEDALGAENVAQFTDGLVVLEKAQGDVLYGKP